MATPLALIWLYIMRHDGYCKVRRILLGSMVLALAGHLAFPLAPPWMLPAEGFVDTLAVWGQDIHNNGNPAVNRVAAMPSLHFGWAVLVAAAIVMNRRSPIAWIAVAHPAITLVAIVATGNHYWADAVVGGGIIALLYALDAAWEDARASRRGRHRRPALGHRHLTDPRPPGPRRAPAGAGEACPSVAPGSAASRRRARRPGGCRTPSGGGARDRVTSRSTPGRLEANDRPTHALARAPGEGDGIRERELVPSRRALEQPRRRRPPPGPPRPGESAHAPRLRRGRPRRCDGHAVAFDANSRAPGTKAGVHHGAGEMRGVKAGTRPHACLERRPQRPIACPAQGRPALPSQERGGPLGQRPAGGRHHGAPVDPWAGERWAGRGAVPVGREAAGRPADRSGEWDRAEGGGRPVTRRARAGPR